MNKKTLSTIMWILSIFFFLGAISGLLASQPGSWTGIFLLIPALLFNPKINDILKNKYNFNNQWWIKVLSVLIPMIIIGSVSPKSSITQSPSNTIASSNTVLTSSTVENSKVSSPISSSVTPSSVQLSSAEIQEASTAAPIVGSKLKVHYINVGQGDSEFFELPNGQTMLIDAGNPENGSQIVSYIKGLGHNKIDYLIATHPHADHIGGMETVVRSIDIGKIYMPKVSSNTQTFENLLSAIQSKGLKVNTAKAGINLLKSGNLNIDILAPVGTSFKDLNQYSAVIKVIYGDNKFLFMGDAGTTSEGQITTDVKADVLKVGHHGSNTATSETFIKKVSPKYAVIEVGKGNSYGHPTTATLTKLKNVGATIYRTDENGTIIFTSDAKTITVDKKASPVKEQAPPASASKPQTTTTKKPNTVIVTPSDTTDNQSITVYVTNTGEKYHTDGCQYLRKSKIAITLKDAKSQGYTPCSKCHPPQ
jgi:Predicted hydrolase (metallo-beta-lactamase superfamily)